MIEFFEIRVLQDSFDMLFGMFVHQLRNIATSDEKIAVLDSIRDFKIISNLNLRRKEDKVLELPFNIKYWIWERYARNKKHHF